MAVNWTSTNNHILINLFPVDCKNEFSRVFCKRFQKYCAYSNANGMLLREKCRFQCGCPWSIRGELTNYGYKVNLFQLVVPAQHEVKLNVMFFFFFL